MNNPVLTHNQIWALVLQVTIETVHELAHRIDGWESAEKWKERWDQLAHQIAEGAVEGFLESEQTVLDMYRCVPQIGGHAINEMVQFGLSETGLPDVNESAFANWLGDFAVELNIDSQEILTAGELAAAWLEEQGEIS